MAVNYAAYIYNHMPNDQGIAPADLFTGVQVPRHKLKDIHVWGCPAYVLDLTLQQGKKLPRWQPQSRRGIFVGLSGHHSSDVPLILNLTTGSISPQFHVVFDDTFSTVMSVTSEEEPPKFWNDLCLELTHQVPLEKDVSVHLPDDWLTPDEVEEKRRAIARADKIRPTYQHRPSTITQHPDIVSDITPIPTPMPTSVPPRTPVIPAVIVPPDVPVVQEVRRSSHSNKDTFSSTKYTDESYLSSVLDTDSNYQDYQLAYLAELCTDFDTGIINCADPRAYAAKMKLKDPDTPSLHEAMHGADAEHCIAAMNAEIQQLIKQNTWEPVCRDKVPLGPNGKPQTILKGTWAFKLK